MCCTQDLVVAGRVAGFGQVQNGFGRIEPEVGETGAWTQAAIDITVGRERGFGHGVLLEGHGTGLADAIARRRKRPTTARIYY
jgi:hypothetical protein